MESRQANELKMLVNAAAFSQGLIADHFARKPTAAVDAKHAGSLSKLNAAIAGLGGKQAAQVGGEFGQHTDQMRATRAEIEETLRTVNRAVAAEAEAQEKPDLMDRFRMPYGHGDGEQRAKLTAFADALEELGLADLMAEHGSDLTPTTLRAMAGGAQQGSGDQGIALADRAGATAAIPKLLRKGRAAVRMLNSIYRNVFKRDAEKLAAWRTASHVERPDTPADPKPPADGSAPKA